MRLQSRKANKVGAGCVFMSRGAAKAGSSSGAAPRRPELGLVDGLDLHAEYLFDRTGGDFFDAVRVGTRVAFVLSDIAGKRPEVDTIASAMQEAFRATAAEVFGAVDANLMEGAESLVHALNLALIGSAHGVCFAPTTLGCFDAQFGLLAFINAGGQTMALRDSDGTRALPNTGLPLGLTTHMTYEASMQAFEPGARLIVVTKGVIAVGRGKNLFGAAGVLEALKGAQATGARELCKLVLTAAHGFEKRGWRLRFGRKPVRDDMTALVMVRSGG
jgi:serine phosphatase RsbU (regulator of sigma subunit)